MSNGSVQANGFEGRFLPTCDNVPAFQIISPSRMLFCHSMLTDPSSGEVIQ